MKFPLLHTLLRPLVFQSLLLFDFLKMSCSRRQVEDRTSTAPLIERAAKYQITVAPLPQAIIITFC